ncbi:MULTISPECIES: PTS transporter subunit EIIC [unclassified Breznakia]|uniref:PTS transporter subunit EIIC n=1 Tax=unclassified Breznakia TaxID=2623764 RepID=UPI002473F0AD|nr:MULTISPECIES: PTS transporter subunit EIIC [unclassified Breznakia]MDH6366632.1 PTS system beta-glucosides-specific IIC component [Breznakia sp. PH1-1]MDH6403725.1 PTS system beta-glucosides-specific IIC component [Breznakia sp. PF1-11]MDH6411434.1 PTS system beta-glucosides-specific IIC component [Breznakia sp. PFB1-11]MDH6413835.1 PTS system beta-glucosides-specific IIC component [Breznakia sp. PFB1-14]MDH6416265.1 PTS system beta-glucosides-specific IIC component [Breznakia sp. PFB1-4]
MNFDHISKDLLNIIGSSNVTNVTHCATRLRVDVKDIGSIDTTKVESVDGVLGVVKQGSTLQVIFGPNVEQVYNAFSKLTGSSDKRNETSVETKKENPFSRALSFLAAAFLPTMPIVVATGLISALLNILVLTIGLSTDSPTYTLINAIASTGFFFLPLYVGYGCAKQLNINPIYGIFLGAVLLNQSINGVENLDLFGIPVLATTYSYTALPVLLGVVVMAQTHKLIYNIIPSYLKDVIIPLVVILVGTLVTLLIVGPLGVILGDWMTEGFVFIHDKIGWLALGLVGALFGFTVLTGTNKALVPIMVTALATQGYDTFLIPAMLGTNIAIATSALAVAYLEKDPVKKGTQISAGVTGLMGISEPALFGVLIKDRKALIGSMVGGAVGGILAGLTNLAQNSIVSGIPGLPTMIISIPPYDGLTNMYWGIAVIVVSGIVGFLTTLLLKKRT